MKPKIFKIEINKAKATIHNSGKLGFNIEAIEVMQLKSQGSYLLATDEERSDLLYLIPTDSADGVGKVAKAGDYYYLNVGDAFQKLGFKYTEYTIMFDIEKNEYDGKDIFILKKRKEIKRKEKSTTTEGGTV
ncbi:hypothetical protein [Daejeonella lutea]|uniref:Uncharacterized protein n=1 Tax=Daejeonella lutea TaxID=572036 RepID=A0A1T4ZWX9_9SPHI|nr:hypothetical protein [Daejeonella lutea]SKB27105.1 hypothetical protein SAMN05661099_0014 [Daejeonella lutea]